MLFKKEIPLKYRFAACWQWFSVGFCYVMAVIAGIFMALLSTATSKKGTNQFGESTQAHKQKYIDQGSSGTWYYMASEVPFIRLWSNYEDGDLGEPSGKQSARCGGKEASFWNRYKWNAFRNPFNMGKRTVSFFHCLVDDCDIEYWGDRVVQGKYNQFGWYFIRAVDRNTGKVYYGYTSAEKNKDSETFTDCQLGFKVKPTHSGVIQDKDDKDKAFTISRTKSELRG